jgi:hypothetical protein
MNFSTDLSYVLSTLFGKKQAGSSFDLLWYCTHSQHFPFLLHGSYEQLQISMFFLILSQAISALP